MYGVDLSHHNSDSEFETCINNPNVRFIILKATEGKTYVDPKFKSRARIVLESGKLLGAYHFCRPENKNSIDDESKNFMDVTKDFRCRRFIDIEGNALKYPQWCDNFLSYLSKIDPNIGYYCSLSPSKNELKSLYGKYPLWVAHYNLFDDKGCTHCDNEIITQYTSTPFDMDYADDSLADNWYIANNHTTAVNLTDDEIALLEIWRAFKGAH